MKNSDNLRGIFLDSHCTCSNFGVRV